MNRLPRKKNRENPLPNHIDHSVELRVKQQDKGNGLPQSIAGYDPHLLQTMLIQCVSQQLWEGKKTAKKREKGQIKKCFSDCLKFILGKAASSSALFEHISKTNHIPILVFTTVTPKKTE